MNRSKTQVAGIGAGTILRRNAYGQLECVTDEVVIEEPLEIRIDNHPLAVTMRTPGDDLELAIGFLLSEGIIHARDDIEPTVIDQQANVVNLKLAAHVKWEAAPAQRFGTISSSCGLCGKTSIEFLRQKLPPLPPVSARIEVACLLKMPEQLRQAQRNFARTGGLHAAAIFDLEGDLIVLREDIGRHNAVDKAIGWALSQNRLPLSRNLLLVSGRTSLEIVQKALAAGLPIVASVSAPSSLAANFSREVGQTLIGFLRPPTFNVYAHVERIAPG